MWRPWIWARNQVIMAGELFEHITNHRSFLEGVKRHLTPDGVLIASVPNANSLNYFGQTLVFGHEVDAWDHASFFTPVTFSVMLKKCGFVPVEIVLYQPDEIFHHTSALHRGGGVVFQRDPANCLRDTSFVVERVDCRGACEESGYL